MDLVVGCYRLTQQFPRSETYGLSSQIQRAAVSVPANIAEGQGREAIREYLHHLSIANGSLMELETHLLIAGRLNYLPESDLTAILSQTAEVGRMLTGLTQALKKKLKP
jgi:four helix bundle protein